MSAFDAVDGARPAVSKCYSSCVENESNQGGETTANLGAESLKELARTRRRNADKVDAGIGRTRVGQRIFECVLSAGNQLQRRRPRASVSTVFKRLCLPESLLCFYLPRLLRDWKETDAEEIDFGEAHSNAVPSK
jgi:hypothetical protein